MGALEHSSHIALRKDGRIPGNDDQVATIQSATSALNLSTP
jgi:hypothetical protein